jgi:phosphate-selective porin OprO/OprP
MFDVNDVRYSVSHAVRASTAALLWLVAVECAAQEAVPGPAEMEAAIASSDEPATTIRLRGRIDTDAIATTQSAANVATFGDLGDVVGLRRARIGVEGDLAIGGRYITEIDLASGQVVIRDMFLGLGDVQDGGELRGGHYREPFSLEMATGANYFAFLERAAINVLDPARNWGLGLFRANPDEAQTFALGVFQAGTDQNDFQTHDGSTVGLTGKLTAAPINEGNGERLLHLGLAFSERLPERGTIVIRQQTQSPLLGLGDAASSAFVPTVGIPANFQQLLNLQFAAASGPFWTQAEWYGTWIDQRGGSPVFFHGCHADCGYFLTGEHRQYQGSSGAFGPVRVNHPLFRCCACDERALGWGAWELTARFAFLDFQDSSTPTGPAGQLVGIRLPEYTVGVNWYLADHMRLMFNYTYALPEEPNSGTSVANIFSTRLGVFW